MLTRPHPSAGLNIWRQQTFQSFAYAVSRTYSSNNVLVSLGPHASAQSCVKFLTLGSFLQPGSEQTAVIWSNAGVKTEAVSWSPHNLFITLGVRCVETTLLVNKRPDLP